MHVRYSRLLAGDNGPLCCCGAARPSSPAGDWITPRRWRCWSFVFWLPGRAGAAGYRPSARLLAPGTRLQTAATGLMLIGGYSVCYFEAMANGVTPGLIATIMGIQPILTLCVSAPAWACQACCHGGAGAAGGAARRPRRWRRRGSVCAGGAAADDLWRAVQKRSRRRRRMSCRCSMPLVWGCAC